MQRILPLVALSGAARVQQTIAGSGFTPGEAVDPQTRPLAILLDGRRAESMPVWSPLAALTREGETAAGGLPADRRDR